MPRAVMTVSVAPMASLWRDKEWSILPRRAGAVWPPREESTIRVNVL
jgi:hypothetical protein